MTTTTTDLWPVSPYRRLIAVISSLLSRDEFFAGLYILGCANGLGGDIIRSMTSGDWTGGIANISVFIWFACFAGISLILRDKNEKIRTADLLITVPFLAMVAAPASQINWAAVTGLSLYILLFAKSAPARRRGAIIMLAVTVPTVWSPLLYALFSRFIIEIDASMVGWLLDTQRTGNIIRFVDGTGQMVILPACSSLANVSLALLCWVTITQWSEHRRSYQDFLWCLLACGSVVAMNVSRIALMGQDKWYYETFHYGWGATLVALVTFCLTIGFSLLGVRRELFPRI